jgi:hypothetical protein
MNISTTKVFPNDYSSDAVDVLNAMSFTNGENMLILGSMSVRHQLYAGDYDGYEIINNDNLKLETYLNMLVEKFKSNIKKLQSINSTYIADIKCGEIEEWKILNDDIIIKNNSILNYNEKYSKNKLMNVYNSNIINKDEFLELDKKLKSSITIKDYLELKDMCKFHIVRWKASEILKGTKILKDGSTKYTLKNGINSDSLCKMDVVSLVQNNRFTDFSVIYQFNYNKKPLNKVILDLEQSLKENILVYFMKKNYFKMSKRIYALSKYRKDNKTINLLTKLFNSDLGIIYQIYGDIGTLEYIIENVNNLPKEKIVFEIEQFKHRLSNITLNEYLKERTKILDIINYLTDVDFSNKQKILDNLLKLRKYLESIMNDYTEVYLKDINYLPVQKRFLP